MRRCRQAGRIIAAGPTPDHEIGIIVLGHLSEAELHEACGGDPFVAHGYRSYEAMPWEVHHVLGIGGFDQQAVTAMAAADKAG
ncbi:YciI family protein [Saccharopolyspora shandongensis]|uniref:YciI family protein n=1 Tax=Saccharopolyspora shandongensis TaxID=418495 RepID=UPI0033E972C6